IPARYMKKIERSGFGEHLFADIKETPGFDVPVNPILVSGVNFGCGSSREHAPWALEDFGFRVIIAKSFADIFRGNSPKIGLLPVVLEADDVDFVAAQDSAVVDLEAQEVRAGGKTFPFEFDAEIRHRLLNGLDDIALTLTQGDAIDAYEAERERSGPNTLQFT
ncbi:MAG: 3-isopropylmalate dehydratase small subunit, partial [Solirubrobacteraceae bacterium]|nr:3-isopropylmalate dehydratase small subunit [Solirubrobacteraceae bacterium]